MTWENLKSEVLKLLEEYSDTDDELTDDDDIALKIIPATNKILFELARTKKILVREQRTVSNDEVLNLKDLDNFYQIKNIRGVEYSIVGSYVTFEEDGEATIYYYKYPELITEDTEDDYTLELDMDALNVAPTGIAGTILMNDISNQYGKIFSNNYEQMLARLDSRVGTESVTFEGGIDV